MVDSKDERWVDDLVVTMIEPKVEALVAVMGVMSAVILTVLRISSSVVE